MKNAKHILSIAAVAMGLSSVAFAATDDLQQSQDQAFDQVKQVEAKLVTGFYVPLADPHLDVPVPNPVVPVFAQFVTDGAKCSAAGFASADELTRRAFLRIRNITCVYTNGEVINSQVDGVVVGSDNKAGVAGVLVVKLSNHKRALLSSGSKSKNRKWLLEVSGPQNISVMFRPKS